MKMKIKMIGLVFLVILALPLVSALSKPISGKLGFENTVEQLAVNIYVEIDSPFGGKQTCVINPTIKNGLDGSFSTNLQNLVLKDFSTVNCNTFWKKSDPIWFETNSDGKMFSSDREQIEPGTGLQLLETLSLELITEQPPSSNEGATSAGGSGGGGSGSSSTSPLEEETSKGSILFKPEVLAHLSLNQEGSSLDAQLNLELLNNLESDLSIKLVLFALPNGQIIKTVEDNVFLTAKVERKYHFDVDNFGRYKLQALVYFQDELLTVSNLEFFLVKELTEDKGIIGKAVQKPSGIISDNSSIYIILIIIILLVIISLILLIIRKKRKIK